jgi:cell division protein FtsW (lipid II flippase)
MKRFYWRMLLVQTALYALMSLMFLDLQKNERLLWHYVLLCFYCLSVIVTFVIPMTRLWMNEHNNKLRSKPSQWKRSFFDR